MVSASKFAKFVEWLDRNTFWNSELLDIAPSALGGLGVFWKLRDQDDEDPLLLRIPKQTVLSPKNSYIFSLLVEYESSNPEIDLTHGMHAVVIAFIYEMALGEMSPWHPYIETFDWQSQDLPICLWSDSEKNLLANTECDLVNMLDPSELIEFYDECVLFAKANSKHVSVPEILLDAAGTEGKLQSFARCVQAVISRAFTVDKFFGLSLVPGADLFNHLSPIIKDGVPAGRENVHFVCEDDDDLCEDCGEVGCEHGDEDEDALGDEQMGSDEEELEEGEDSDEDSISESVTASLTSSDSEGDIDSHEHAADHCHDKCCADQEIESEQEEEEEEEISAITMEYIEKLDKKLSEEADTDGEDEEMSTEEELIQGSPENDDLAELLSDSQKCCDIVKVLMPEMANKFELFNTYGNDLSNAYLLQRYGFICPGNASNRCLLSVLMLAYVKKNSLRALSAKLDWYEEIGFPILNSIVMDADDQESFAVPESWQLSPVIQYDGLPTVQTVALAKLLLMGTKDFQLKLALVTKEHKVAKSIQKLLVAPSASTKEKTLICDWIEARLRRYGKSTDTIKIGDGGIDQSRATIIKTILEEEKLLLERGLKALRP